MSKEFQSRRPDLSSLDPDLDILIRSNAIRIDGGEISNDDVQQMSDIVRAAKKAGPLVCELKENLGLNGFALAVSKNDMFYPTLFVEVGEVKREHVQEANLKMLFIKDNPKFTSSSQNFSLPEADRMYSNSKSLVEGGALLYKNDWIISISGLQTQHMDTVLSLVTAVGSNLIGFDEAITRAREEDRECLDLFVKYKDRFTEPFFTEINDRDELPEEPHLNI